MVSSNGVEIRRGTRVVLAGHARRWGKARSFHKHSRAPEAAIIFTHAGWGFTVFIFHHGRQ